MSELVAVMDWLGSGGGGGRTRITVCDRRCRNVASHV